MKKTKPTKPPSEEYSRFEQLARAVIAVPKSELDKRRLWRVWVDSRQSAMGQFRSIEMKARHIALVVVFALAGLLYALGSIRGAGALLILGFIVELVGWALWADEIARDRDNS